MRSWFKNQPCWYCGLSAQDRDHVVPRIKGGNKHGSKIVPACYWCNTTKSHRDLEEFRLWLQSIDKPRLQEQPSYKAIKANKFMFYGEINSVVYVEGGAIRQSKPFRPPALVTPQGRFPLGDRFVPSVCVPVQVWLQIREACAENGRQAAQVPEMR